MIAKRVTKSVIFCIVLAFAVNSVYHVLAWKDTAGDYVSSVESFYDLDDDVVDVLFLGSSHCYCSINNSILWNKYGIASFSLAISGQDIVSTYYTLAEAFKTQNPQVVCVEISSATTLGYQVVGNLYRNTLSLKRSANSYEAVRSMVKDDDPMDYWLKWPIIHTRYAELQREDFDDDRTAYIGYSAGFVTNPTWDSVSYLQAEPVPIAEENEEYIRKIIELVQGKGARLCFFVAPYSVDQTAQGMYRYVEGIADEYDVDFMNLTYSQDGLTLNMGTDFIDSFHTNYYGAEKTTAYMGNYLHSNYSLPDRRGQEGYELWDEDAMARLHEVQNQSFLLQEPDIKSYLYYIRSLEEYTLFVFTEGDYLAENVTIEDDLQTAGIGEEFYSGRHVWVFENSQLKYSAGEEAGLYYADIPRGEYAVSITEEGISLLVNRAPYKMVADGINIVVYDNLLGKVVDSVGFNGQQDYAPVR